jgi:hypothetical protein
MKKAHLFAAILVALLLSGCATGPTIFVAEPVAAKEAANPASGYVAATTVFRDDKNPGGASLGLVNVATRAEYLLTIGSTGFHDAFRDLNNEPRMIAIPPGQYRLAFWASYQGASGTCSLKAKTAIPDRSPLAMSFSVAANGITFLGSFTTEATHRSDGQYNITNWTVKPNPISLSEARKALFSPHPEFSKLDFFCPRCTDNNQPKH